MSARDHRVSAYSYNKHDASKKANQWAHRKSVCDSFPDFSDFQKLLGFLTEAIMVDTLILCFSIIETVSPAKYSL